MPVQCDRAESSFHSILDYQESTSKKAIPYHLVVLKACLRNKDAQDKKYAPNVSRIEDRKETAHQK